MVNPYARDHLYPTRRLPRPFAGFVHIGAARGRHAHAAALIGFGLAEQAQIGRGDGQGLGDALEGDALGIHAAVDDGAGGRFALGHVDGQAQDGAGVQRELAHGLAGQGDQAGVVGAGRDLGEPDLVALDEQFDAEDAETAEGVGDLAGDVLRGGDGNDTLFDSEGANDFDGGAGDDLLSGFSVNGAVDQLTGGEGRDTFSLVADQGGAVPSAFNAAIDVITDFTAGDDGDIIDAPFNSGNGNPFPGNTAFLVYVEQDGADTLVSIDQNDGNGRFAVLRLTGVDATTLTQANFGGASFELIAPRNIAGTDGMDLLTGGVAGDTINGGYGADTIRGGDGSDLLIGDDGVANPSPIDLASYFGSVTSALISGLGGTAGFGEAALVPSSPYQNVYVGIPSDFNGGSFKVGNNFVGGLNIDSYGTVTIGDM
ncbi:hypothetical protein LTR94_018052, partial [Friedmanniomyces endolithicus]